MLRTIKWFFSLMWRSFKLLKRNNPLMLASSTAFFSTFALSPILVLLVTVLGLYFKNETLRDGIFQKIQSVFGEESAQVIEGIVRNIASVERTWYVSVLGFLFLLFIATTLLQIIRQAVNLLWKIRRKDTHRFSIRLMERTKATVLLIILGALFVVSILLDAAAALMRNHLEEFLTFAQDEVILALNLVFSLLVVTTWFTLLFKLLPDGKPHWRTAFGGGLFTALLFSAGKWILGRLLVYSVAVNIFGASASFALILLFIFYSSFILYYGASFTYVLAEETDLPISAGKYGDRFEINVVGKDTKTEGPAIE